MIETTNISPKFKFGNRNALSHCVKSVQMRSFFWSDFPVFGHFSHSVYFFFDAESSVMKKVLVSKKITFIFSQTTAPLLEALVITMFPLISALALI